MKNKKLFILLLVTATLLSLLTLSVSASDTSVKVSEDYSSLTYNGDTYLLIDSNGDYFFETDEYTSDIILTDTQASEIGSVEVYTSDNFIELYIQYNKGGSACYSYAHEDIIDEFYDFALRGGESYKIALWHGEVITDRDKIFGKEVTMKGYELNYYYYEDYVTTIGFDGKVSSIYVCGYLFGDGIGNIYYVDYSLSPSDPTLPIAMNETLTVWQITDEDLIEEINEKCYEDQYGNYDDFGDMDEVPLIIALIIFAFLLGIVPLAGAVACFIFALRSDGIYKKGGFIAAAILAAAALITVITVIIIIVLA